MAPSTHLVLGGSGFIGRHVAACLAHTGCRVVVAGRNPPPPFPDDFNLGLVSFVKFDLRSQNWDALLSDCDVVHYYVWTTTPQTANNDPLEDLETNVVSVIQLLDALRRRPGTRIVFASSGGTVYGKVQAIPVREDHSTHPISAYGASKLAAEKYIGFYCAQYGIDGRIARISNPFGSGRNPKRNLGAVDMFMARALAGKPITIWGDGSVVRDYIHVSDVASAMALLATKPLSQISGSSIFNIGSGEGRSLNEIITNLQALLSRMIEVEYQPGRPFDVPINVLDISHANEQLSWRPRLSFDEGLRLTLNDMSGPHPQYSTIQWDGT